MGCSCPYPPAPANSTPAPLPVALRRGRCYSRWTRVPRSPVRYTLTPPRSRACCQALLGGSLWGQARQGAALDPLLLSWPPCRNETQRPTSHPQCWAAAHRLRTAGLGDPAVTCRGSLAIGANFQGSGSASSDLAAEHGSRAANPLDGGAVKPSCSPACPGKRLWDPYCLQRLGSVCVRESKARETPLLRGRAGDTKPCGSAPCVLSKQRGSFGPAPCPFRPLS